MLLPASRRWWTPILQGLTALLATSGLVMAGWLSVGILPVTPVLAQMIGATTAAPSSESLFEFAVRQGGAFVILFVVLFYYRRDYRDLTDYKTLRDQVLVELVKENVKASADMANALRENNVVVHQAKNVLKDYVAPPSRRMGDLPT